VLEVEITETVIMADGSDANATLLRLKEAGVSVAIDDIGTGYSSLSYLHKLPVDKIKIDQSFIMGMTESQGLRAIVASTIALAHELRFKVVAEGIETADVQALLETWSCDELQGYDFSKPLPVAEFEQFRLSYGWCLQPNRSVTEINHRPSDVVNASSLSLAGNAPLPIVGASR